MTSRVYIALPYDIDRRLHRVKLAALREKASMIARAVEEELLCDAQSLLFHWEGEYERYRGTDYLFLDLTVEFLTGRKPPVPPVKCAGEMAVSENDTYYVENFDVWSFLQKNTPQEISFRVSHRLRGKLARTGNHC